MFLGSYLKAAALISFPALALPFPIPLRTQTLTRKNVWQSEWFTKSTWLSQPPHQAWCSLCVPISPLFSERAVSCRHVGIKVYSGKTYHVAVCFSLIYCVGYCLHFNQMFHGDSIFFTFFCSDRGGEAIEQVLKNINGKVLSWWKT